ncbi:DNA-binding MarR family transcriptional regulator [Nocardioides aromaticivorans]|uniref:DNA-binding MarR family transcriptional regulator n=1 Tax=Nocardioides aromaticivorans TaxID=200618 RepID=A0A7Y9ZGJ7_9ACTN|nr:MarR family winged helix-turn-helix transcriptional regulator [Nocardioides aromaticivorans]NYI45049.1 DNA-binding MarR family transcriptional regulator [Nocardioides aromaticivorans]
MNGQVGNSPFDFAAASPLSDLFRVANAVRSELTNRVLRRYDLTWTGFIVLAVVWNSDGVETRHVAECADVSKATLTGVVKTLEGRGLLLREGDQRDRRLVRLRLTDKGTALTEQVHPEFHAVESAIISQLSGRKVSALTRTLRDMLDAVEGHVDTPATTRAGA